MGEPHKARLPRVERHDDHNPYGHQGEDHGWAVSYADVLMVLLSFFVVFFSIDKGGGTGLLNEIALKFSKPTSRPGDVGSVNRDESGVKAQASHASTSKGVFGSASDQDLRGATQLIELLSALGIDSRIVISRGVESVSLLLPDDLYGPGRTELEGESRNLLVGVLDKLKKFKDQVDIAFIGSSDATPIRAARTKSIQSNFDLSAIRASRALDIAVAEGFSTRNLSVKGAGEVGRASRTLSLEIKIRGGQ